MFVLSFLLVLLLFIGAFILTIFLFIHNSQKDKNIGKKSYTFAFLAWIFVISFALRLTSVLFIANYSFSVESFGEGIVRALDLLYVTGGGLTFEGQDISQFADKTFFAILYYGSILWLATTYIFIISLGVNYELSSLFRLHFLSKRCKYVYIFTSITDDALILAKNIELYHEIRNREDPLIIFAGFEIPPYDKDDENHRDIMSRGYIFRSLYKSKAKKYQKPLIGILGLSRKSDGFLGGPIDRHIKVFSIGNDKESYGLESKNSSDVFEDIEMFLRKNLADQKSETITSESLINALNPHIRDDNTLDILYVDYYVLSNSTVNYEFYDSKIYELIHYFFEEGFGRHYILLKDKKLEISEKKPVDKNGKLLEGYNVIGTVYEYIKSIFQIHIINEAYLASEDLIRERHEIECVNIAEDLKNSENAERRKFAINRISAYRNQKGVDVFEVKGNDVDLSTIKDPIERDFAYENKIEHIQGEKRFNALFLGFGQTGQTALHNLFVDSVAVDPSDETYNKFIPTRFVAHVYDIKIGQNIGLFAQTHPSYLVKKVDGKNSRFFNYKSLVNYYKNDYPGDFAEIDELTKFPFVYAYERNCKDLDFLTDIGGSTGVLSQNVPGKVFTKLNAIVIALGSDEENINVANAILQNVRQEIYHSDYTERDLFNQTIYINVRNEQNLARINWNDAIELARHKGIYVRTFGNRENMYSYYSIISIKNYVMINNIYRSIDAYFNQVDPNWTLSGEEKNAIVLDVEHQKNITNIIHEKSEGDEGLREYLKLGHYKKASNKNASSFSRYYKTYIDTFGKDKLDQEEGKKLWKYLSFLEHNRWSRYVMSIGYAYSTTFMKNVKPHKEDYEIYKEFGYEKPNDYCKEVLKLHNCIIPNSYPNKNYLPIDYECYDYANVIFISNFDEIRKKKK